MHQSLPVYWTSPEHEGQERRCSRAARYGDLQEASDGSTDDNTGLLIGCGASSNRVLIVLLPHRTEMNLITRCAITITLLSVSLFSAVAIASPIPNITPVPSRDKEIRMRPGVKRICSHSVNIDAIATTTAALEAATRATEREVRANNTQFVIIIYSRRSSAPCSVAIAGSSKAEYVFAVSKASLRAI